MKLECALSDKRIERFRRTIINHKLWEWQRGGLKDCVYNREIYGIILAKDYLPIGCCFYADHHFNIQTYVSPHYRRRGIGRQMLTKIRKIFPDADFRPDNGSKANRAFYSYLKGVNV